MTLIQIKKPILLENVQQNQFTIVMYDKQINITLQKMKNEQIHQNRPSSRQRYSQLQKQQSFLAEAFKIDNFYQNQKLNLHSLKHKLDEARQRINRSHCIDDRQPSDTIVPLSRKINEKAMARYSKKEDQYLSARAHNSTTLDHNYKFNPDLRATTNKFRQTAKGPVKQFQLKKTAKADMDLTSIITQRQKGMRSQQKATNFAKEFKKSEGNDDKMDGKNQEMPPGRQEKIVQVPKIYSIGHRKNGFDRSPKSTKTRFKIANHLQPLQKKNFIKINLSKIENLRHFQMHIMTIWDLYQRLSIISQKLSNSQSEYDLFSQNFIALLANYRQIACSSRLGFIEEIVKYSLQNSQIKVILLSRVLQNLSIVYIFLEIVQKTFIQTVKQKTKRSSNSKQKSGVSFEASHLVNFVGLCSNNILLLIRVLILAHDVSDSLFLSQKTQKIFQAITQYQQKSFKNELINIRETIMRIQHNNQTISLIQSKINNKMMSSREYHINCIGNFMRAVIVDCLKMTEGYSRIKNLSQNNSSVASKPFYEYSFFIFQYLSYHLHHQNCIGLFPREIQTAPAPYLSLKKQFTVVVNPINTLLHEKKGKIFIRAHTDHFLKQLDKKCNIVFWTDQMPKDIDSLLDLVSPFNQNKGKQRDPHKFLNFNQAQQIKRLYRHHCLYEKNIQGQMMMMKDISRLGCPDNKYFIIDTHSEIYYPEDQVFTILLPWKGQSHDNRLLTTLDLLLPILREGTDLSKGMRLMKPRLTQILKIRKKKKTDLLYGASKTSQHKGNKKFINSQHHQNLSHAQYPTNINMKGYDNQAYLVQQFNIGFQSKEYQTDGEKDFTGAINHEKNDQKIQVQQNEGQLDGKSKKSSQKQIFDRVLVEDEFIQ